MISGQPGQRRLCKAHARDKLCDIHSGSSRIRIETEILTNTDHWKGDNNFEMRLTYLVCAARLGV